MDEFNKYSRIYNGKMIAKCSISDNNIKETYLVLEGGTVKVEEYTANEKYGKRELVKTTILGYIM